MKRCVFVLREAVRVTTDYVGVFATDYVGTTPVYWRFAILQTLRKRVVVVMVVMVIMVVVVVVVVMVIMVVMVVVVVGFAD